MEVAVGLLRDCARSGDWLCLKNVHLAVSWLPSLEKEVYTLQVRGAEGRGEGVRGVWS